MIDAELKRAIKEVIGKFHSTPLPKVFRRDVEMPEFRKVNKVFVIMGPRRAGKTYVLYQTMQSLLKKGSGITDFIYINFESEKISEIRAGQIGLILEAFQELYPEKRGRKPILFFDEIQNVSGWQKAIRRLNDEGHRIYITGSSSKLLSKEIATSLRGRDYPIQVLPLSFREFLEMRNVKLGNNWEFDGTQKTVKKQFEDYLNLSGFPEIVLENRIDFIDQYFKTMMFQDAIERFRIKNTELLRLLMKNMMRQYGQEYSINKFNNFAKSNGHKSSTSVVQKYSKILEDIYFCFFINAKQKSFKKESGYLKKAYICDHGFVNYYNAEKDPGRMLENIVFMELFRRGNVEINYYKNGFECDFITKDSCIQVCHTLNENNEKREVNGLHEADKKFGHKKSIILTYEQETGAYPKIKVVPIWKWLLENGGPLKQGATGGKGARI